MHVIEHTTFEAGTDTWLTPPELLEALGTFDLDPCCPPNMPWQSAKEMYCQPIDGLAMPWHGRVWCNPPYSKPLPWIGKMDQHHKGMMLLSAKSFDSVWGQKLLASADAFYFLKGRLLFHNVTGEKSKGKWLPNVLAAYGKKDCAALTKLASKGFAGIILERKA